MEKTDFIQQHRALFWSVGDAQLATLSDALLVETILNYGTLDDVRGLFGVLGVAGTAAVFRRTSEGRARHNYPPQVANFFKLYFDRHAPRDLV